MFNIHLIFWFSFVTVTVPRLFYDRLFLYNKPTKGQRPSPFNVQRPPFIVHYSPFSVHRPPLSVHRSASTVHRSAPTVHHSPSTVQRHGWQTLTHERWTVTNVNLLTGVERERPETVRSRNGHVTVTGENQKIYCNIFYEKMYRTAMPLLIESLFLI